MSHAGHHKDVAAQVRAGTRVLRERVAELEGGLRRFALWSDHPEMFPEGRYDARVFRAWIAEVMKEGKAPSPAPEKSPPTRTID